MEKSVTYICFVRDHSGSMNEFNSVFFDVIQNEWVIKDKNCLLFNEQIATMKKDDGDGIENLVTVIEFDDTIHVNMENTPLSTIEPLKNYWIGGMTALHDAIGMGIEIVKKAMDNDSRKDKAAIVVIQTDGMENYSSKYSGEEGRLKIKKMIEELEATGIWTFTFLGEGLKEQVHDTAINLGMKVGNVHAMVTKDDLDDSYMKTNEGMLNYMSARKIGSTQTMSFYSDPTKKEEEK